MPQSSLNGLNHPIYPPNISMPPNRFPQPINPPVFPPTPQVQSNFNHQQNSTSTPPPLTNLANPLSVR